MNYIPNLFNEKFYAKSGNNPIVAVLDTGIDPDAKNLQFTPDGRRKIIDVIDCTGSDDLDLVEVDINKCDQYILAEVFNNIEKDSINKYYYGTRPLESYFPNRKVKIFDLDDSDENPIKKIKLNHHLFQLKDEKIIALIEIKNIDIKIDEKSKYVILEDYNEKYDIGSINIDSSKFNFVFHYRFDNDILVSTLVFDSGYHGTHVAGIIGAYDKDDEKRNGINPYVQIVSLKIGDSRFDGMETTKGLINALDYLIKNNIKIANLSFGEPVNTSDGIFIKKLHEAIYKHNILFVTSAGNSGPNLTTTGAPACSTDRIISVGAYLNSHIQTDIYNQIGDYEGLYHWSSRGISKINTMGVDVVSCGCSISTMPNWYSSDLKMLNGTSMASPMVAGLLSIIRSNLDYDPHPFWVKQYLINTCRKLELKPIEAGHGLVGSNFVDYKFMKKDFMIDFDKKGCFLTTDDNFDFKFKLLNIDGTKSRDTINLKLKTDKDSKIKIPEKIDISCNTYNLRFKVPDNTSEYIYGFYQDELVITYPINRIIPEKLKIDEYIEYNDLVVNNKKIVRKYILPSTNRLKFEIKGKCLMSICQIFTNNYGRDDNRTQKYNILSGDAKFSTNIISNTLTEIVLYYPWNSYQESTVKMTITSELIMANIINKNFRQITMDLISHENKNPKEEFSIKSIDYYLTANKKEIKNNNLYIEYEYDEHYDAKDKIFFINDDCNQVYESDVESSGFIMGVGDDKVHCYCNYETKKLDCKINKFLIHIESSKKELLEKYSNIRILISRKINYRKSYDLNLGFNKIDLNIPESLFKNIYQKKLILKCNMIFKFDIEYDNTYEEKIRYYDSDKLLSLISGEKDHDKLDIGNDKMKYVLTNKLDDHIVKSLLNEREYKLTQYLNTKNKNYIEKMRELNYVNRKDDEIIFEEKLFNLLERI